MLIIPAKGLVERTGLVGPPNLNRGIGGNPPTRSKGGGLVGLQDASPKGRIFDGIPRSLRTFR